MGHWKNHLHLSRKRWSCKNSGCQRWKWRNFEEVSSSPNTPQLKQQFHFEPCKMVQGGGKLVKLFLSMLNICTILFHITVFPSLILTFEFESTLGSSNRAREKLWGAIQHHHLLLLSDNLGTMRWRQQYTAAPPCCSNSAEDSLGPIRNSEETLRSWMQLLNTLKILYKPMHMLWEHECWIWTSKKQHPPILELRRIVISKLYKLVYSCWKHLE